LGVFSGESLLAEIERIDDAGLVKAHVARDDNTADRVLEDVIA